MKIQIVAIAPLLVVACTPLPELNAQPAFTAAADSTDAIPPAATSPAISYTPRRIGEPSSWLDFNYEQAEGVE